MKQIKTIKYRLDNAAAFDEAVNKAIEEGWTLTERKVLQPCSQPTNGVFLYNMLYAELERFTEPDECEDSPLCNLVENLAKFAGSLADRNAEKAPDLPEDTEKPKEDAPVRDCADCKHYVTPITHLPCRTCRTLKSWEPRT